MNDEISTKERIAHLIRARIHNYLPCLESAHHTPHLFFTKKSFFDSISFFPSKHEVYRLTIKVGEKSKEIFVKIRENAVSAQKEYSDALRCWKTFSSENFSISCPLDILPEINAVVFSKVDGISIQSLLNRAFFFSMYRFNGTHLTEYFMRVGKWLRAFHDSFGTQESLIDVDRILSQIENWLRNSSIGLSESSIRMICRIAENKARENNSGYMRTSLLHGNFVPSHIFVHGSKVTAIDFERVRYGPVYYDLFSLTLSLDLMSKIFQTCIPDLKKSFFFGYFGDEQFPESIMQLFKIHRTAIKSYVPFPGTFQNSFAHRLLSRILVNRAKTLLKEIERTQAVDLFR